MCAASKMVPLVHLVTLKYVVLRWSIIFWSDAHGGDPSCLSHINFTETLQLGCNERGVIDLLLPKKVHRFFYWPHSDLKVALIIICARPTCSARAGLSYEPKNSNVSPCIRPRRSLVPLIASLTKKSIQDI